MNQLTATEATPQAQIDSVKPKNRKPSTVSYEELKQTLMSNQWEVQASALQLNISRPSIYELLRKYQIATVADFSDDELNDGYMRHQKNAANMAIELQVSKRALIRRLKKCNAIAKN